MSSMKNEPLPRPRLRRHLTLTARDRRVVAVVDELGLATVNQVQLLEFGLANRSRAQTRLGVLRRAGLLDVLPGRLPNEPAVYVTTRRARETLGLGDPAELRSRRVHYGRLGHDLSVNDVRVRFSLAAREPGYRLVRWLDEAMLRPVTLNHGLLPDAWFQLERVRAGVPGKSAYFVEAEVSAKSERGLRAKLTAIGAYLFSGNYAASFGTKALRVLILIKPGPGESASRLVQRMTGLARLVGLPFVRVAELEEFLRLQPDEFFTAPIWSQPGVDGPVPLFAGGSADEQDEQQAA